jgi:hypothetical protein
MSLDGEAFSRAWARGFRHGVRSAAVSAGHEDRALELLRILGVPRSEARMLIEQARHDARLEHPTLPENEQRAIAAQRVARLVLRRLAEYVSESNQGEGQGQNS